jgi:hypothetical protein
MTNGRFPHPIIRCGSSSTACAASSARSPVSLYVVYQQTWCWMEADVFTTIIADLRELIRWG